MSLAAFGMVELQRLRLGRAEKRTERRDRSERKRETERERKRETERQSFFSRSLLFPFLLSLASLTACLILGTIPRVMTHRSLRFAPNKDVRTEDGRKKYLLACHAE